MLLAGPLDFYGMYFKINDEDRGILLSDAMIKKLRLKSKDLEKQIEQDEEDFIHFNKEMKKLLDEDRKKHLQIEDLKLLLNESRTMASKIQEKADRKRDEEVEVVREEMRKMAQKFEVYKQLVAEEVKVNETLRWIFEIYFYRYKQRLKIHKL